MQVSNRHDDETLPRSVKQKTTVNPLLSVNPPQKKWIISCIWLKNNAQCEFRSSVWKKNKTLSVISATQCENKNETLSVNSVTQCENKDKILSVNSAS